ncbi:MAG: molybdopterin converting factor subunit 1 [Alphaproteobacteria bacterium]|nr:molybdopterin converting factor subunit 1 [Pseudomonadota bacterium]
MRILYFASIRQKIGLAAEEVSPPPEVTTVGALLEWLKGRDARHAEALGDPRVVKVAVNQDFADPEMKVAEGDEVAFFPPVTGG